MNSIKKFIGCLLCFSIVLLCGCNSTDKPEEPSSENNSTYGYTFPAKIDDITVESCYLYSGEYVEDASFERCENVAAIKLKNNSSKDIQLLHLNISTDVRYLSFEITTIPAGSTVVALEKSKQTLTENERIIKIECELRADFEDKLSLMEETFLLQCNPKSINIKNISEDEIKSDIYVYYKKVDEDGNFFGGITFRSKADGLKPDAIKQLPAPNFDPDNSEVLFVSYAK